MSPLSPETRELLKGVRAHEPFFSNMIAAELFEAEHTRGPFTILPFAGGGYLVFNRDAPLSKGVLGRYSNILDAHAALEAIAASQAADETLRKTRVASAGAKDGPERSQSPAASGVDT